MPLIGVSAAVVFVAEGASIDAESLSDIFASLKKEAKLSASRTAHQVLEKPVGESSEKTVPARTVGPAFAVFAPALRSSTQ